MSDNWVVQNLENALDTWNDKLSEIWQLITQSPENFKGGTIWNVIVDIHGAVQAIGLALLVLFFVIGVMRTCGSFAEVKKPEHALKLFIRFALAKGVVTYGLELMMALFNIVQGLISTIMNAAGFGTAQQTVLPSEIVTAVEDCGFFESIPLWAVTLIGGLFITVLSFIMIMTVYGRFFKLYLYTAIAPVPLSTFAGEPSQSVGKSFIKSYAAVCLEGAIIVLACIIFSLFAASPPAVDPDAAAVSMVWSYIGELVFNMLVLVGAVKMADRVVREMMGLIKEVRLLEVKINKEIRNYTESMFFGLSLRQFIFSAVACGVAVGLYFILRPYFGTETLSWVCILGASPFAVMGFVKYNGMTAEQFVWAWIKSEFLMPKKLMFHPDNLYYETLKTTIQNHEKEALKTNA